MKNELFRLSLGFMWTGQNTLSFSKHFLVSKQKIIDICVQGVIVDIIILLRLRGVMYEQLIDHVTLQSYLCKPILMHIKKYITKIRLSSHNLQYLFYIVYTEQLCEFKSWWSFQIVLLNIFVANININRTFENKIELVFNFWITEKKTCTFSSRSVVCPSRFNLYTCSLGKYISDAFKLRSNLLR